jgi:dTDP-4-dehydrorhamnose 3,5-epimerase
VKVVDTEITAVKLIEPDVFGDQRGFFLETWNARRFEDAGISAGFVQDNHSKSARGVLRGLHYQIRNPQGKLIRVIAGSVFDVVVDLRRSSPTFGKHVACMLSAEDKRQLWVPQGFAHGFLCLEEGTEFVYKCTDYYSPQFERTLLWNDPALAIDWPLGGLEPILSDKDARGTPLAGAEVFP